VTCIIITDHPQISAPHPPVGLYLLGMWVKFVYEGHQVQKSHKCRFPKWSTVISNCHRYSPDGTTDHVLRVVGP